MGTLINWGLIKQPLNWIIILLMIIIGGFVIDALMPNRGA